MHEATFDNYNFYLTLLEYINRGYSLRGSSPWVPFNLKNKVASKVEARNCSTS